MRTFAMRNPRNGRTHQVRPDAVRNYEIAGWEHVPPAPSPAAKPAAVPVTPAPKRATPKESD